MIVEAKKCEIPDFLIWTSSQAEATVSAQVCPPSMCPPPRVAALGLAAGVLLVLLLFCLYRVLCPRNYGQKGAVHGRRRRGDLPCDDYGYSPPVSEISPLLLRGHSMVRAPPPSTPPPRAPLRRLRLRPQDIECLASDGMLLASCCLAGQIRVWDAQTGDCLTVIPNSG